MATTYISIDATNYRWFGLAAVILGVLGFVCIIFFDRTKRLHVVEILQVSANGSALLDQDGEPVAKSVVVGREDQLRSEAAAALKTARRRGGVSLKQFMSGYGSPVNDPAALWSENLLASISSRIDRKSTRLNSSH